jgi:Taurine catabolism dioxygenase TauD, TfdA family
MLLERGEQDGKRAISRQPMHTDAAYFPIPPRYIMFECIEPGETACQTHVWTFDWNKLLKDQPDILVQPGWIARGERKAPFNCQVLTTTSNGRKFLRFDPLCMTPPSNLVNTAAVSDALCRYANRINFSWRKGDILIVDNWRCLHARGVGADRAPSRRLRRWSIGEANGLVI